MSRKTNSESSPIRPHTTIGKEEGGGARRDEVSKVLVGEKEDDGTERIEGEQIESREEEVQPLSQAKSPEMPTVSEMQAHRETHLPYRNWCPECVEGFGREAVHTSKDQKGRTIPLISLDYLFVTKRGVFSRKEYTPIEGDESLKVIVVYCNTTKSLFAHAIPQKGID